MNIKENFYAKLEHLREDREEVKDGDYISSVIRNYSRDDATPLERRLVPKLKKKLNKMKKKAVTGLDEEQLDELREDREEVKDGDYISSVIRNYSRDDATPLERRLVPKLKKKLNKMKKKAVTGLDEEQLDELRGKGTVDKKEMQAHIRKKHGEAWEKTQDIRKEKKSAGPADTKDMDKYRNRLAKMHNKLDK